MIEVSSKIHRYGIYAIVGIPLAVLFAALQWTAAVGVPLGIVGAAGLIFTLATRDGRY